MGATPAGPRPPGRGGADDCERSYDAQDPSCEVSPGILPPTTGRRCGWVPHQSVSADSVVGMPKNTIAHNLAATTTVETLQVFLSNAPADAPVELDTSDPAAPMLTVAWQD